MEEGMNMLTERLPMKRLIVISALLLAAGCATATPSEQILRVSPRAAHERVVRGQTLLVCAYRDQDCRGTHLAGEIALEELEARLPGLSPNQEILFVCGCAH